MKLTKPRLAAHLEDGDVQELAPEATIENVRYVGVDVSGQQLNNISLDEVCLDKLLAVQARLDKWQLSDVIARACEWSGARCTDGSVIRCSFENCRGSGWDLSSSTLKDVTFQSCKLDMANFRFVKFTRVRFIDCSLIEADFQGAQLNQVAFEDCVLERTEFGQATIKEVDLRGSKLIELRGWSHLAGATVDELQLVAIAPQLAAAIGLKVA